MCKVIPAIIITLSLTACCDCREESASQSSLMELGSEAEGVQQEPASVVQRANHEKAATYYGIDISHYQGDLVDRIQKKDTLHFVVCKATQGVTYTDPDFRSNWKAIKSEGLIRGAYHFYMFADDPAEQADHFIESIEDIETSDIAPVVDVEEGGLAKSINAGKMQSDLKAFLKLLESKFNRKPIIYCDPSFANRYLNDSFFGDYPLWLADYTKGQPRVPNAWKSKGYLIWQKSGSYTTLSATVDLDVFHGKLKDLIQ